MLRRIANQLFWAARNLERAEERARLVDVNYHVLIETPPRDTPEWEPLLAIFAEQDLFSSHYNTADQRSVLSFFTLDLENPNSIRSCIVLARENISALRHYVSSEFWLALNTLYLETQEWTAGLFDSPGVYAFFSELRGSFYRISGIRQSTIPRDLAYDFMRLGIMIERAEDVSRMLDVKYHFLLPRLEDVGGPVDLLQWTAVLRSASALEAYRKRFGNAIRVDRLVEILLFDPTFPRSARYAIEQFEISMRRISVDSSVAVSKRVSELLHDLRENRAAECIKSGLHEFLLGVQDSCKDIFKQIDDDYLKTQ
jgi:uncharacterized alpha-E superfamily protein